MSKTLEQKAAETILQRATNIKIGDREYKAAPPSTATLILVSEAVSHLPQLELNNEHVAEETLRYAKDLKALGDIVAILILGARNITETVTTRETRYKTYFGGLLRRPITVTVTKEVDRKAELSKQILEEFSPSQLHSLIALLLQRLELADFFAVTTFLTEINLLRKTKVEN